MSDLHERYNEIEQLMDAGKDAQAVEGLNALVAEDDTFVLAHLSSREC
ncbi:MAG: hypothetical protein R3C05_07985 [Pirellulaceae bacterium]